MNDMRSNKGAPPGPPVPGTDAIRPERAASVRRPGWLAYALAVAGNVVTLFVYLTLPFTTDNQPAPIVFLLPIILSAYVGGLGPGLVSTVLATLSAIYFLMPPLDSFYIARPVDYVRLATLIVAGVLISVLNEALHRSRQRAEASQRLQAVTLASIGDAVMATDRQGCITFLNPEAERLTGWTRQEAVGQPLASIFRIVNEQTRQPVEDPVQKVLRCGTVVGLANHTLLLARDSREIPIDDSGALIKQADGTMQGMVLVFRDCSERRQAEQAIQRQAQQNEFLANIIELSSQPFGVGYPDGRLGLTNQAFERLTGYTGDELRATDWAKTLTPPEWRELEQQQLEELRRTGQPVRYEKEYVRKDGTRVPIELLVHLLADADGKPEYYYSFITDITERKRAEESRLRSQKLEALGTLAGGIAHDFNNILLAISGNTELAATDLPPQHPAQENLAEIAKVGARATDLVRRILIFSRPQEQQRQVLQLQPIVAEALKLLRATLPAMIELRTEFAPAVPAVTVDAAQIHQVIVNLATNAAHAIGPRGGLIEFRLDATPVSTELARTSSDLRAGYYTRLSVSDNGGGMDQATLKRIFDPFFTTKPTGQGSGLGLSVVHSIMQSHGGAVTVYSQPGQGSTFRLYFPAVESALGTAAPPPREVARGQGERVLYIDDEQALVSLATRMLKRLGCVVTGYTDPVGALAEFRSRPGDFDVVVTDLSMPGMSGFELSRALQDIRPDVPIILSSGYLSPEDQATAERLGIRALILKPNTMKELGQVLQRLSADGGPGENAP